MNNIELLEQIEKNMNELNNKDYSFKFKLENVERFNTVEIAEIITRLFNIKFNEYNSYSVCFRPLEKNINIDYSTETETNVKKIRIYTFDR